MKRILVPIDFSGCSVNALNYAASLARYLPAKIFLLHVYQVPIPATDVPLLEIPSSDELEREFSERMHQLVREQRKKQGWTEEVSILNSQGITHSEINRTAKEKGIDLVVMGMRGKNTVLDRVFGSTATEMIKKANCPLLLIPEGAAFEFPDRIAVAVDFAQPGDLHKLGITRDFAGLFSATLEVFSILQEREDDPSDRAVVFDALKKNLGTLEHSIHFQVHENVTEGILNFTEEIRAKMLVMFHHSHTVFSRFFKSIHSKEISFDIKIPMLVITKLVEA